MVKCHENCGCIECEYRDACARIAELEAKLEKAEQYVYKLRLFGWKLTDAVYNGTTPEQHDAAADLIKLMEGSDD